MLDDRNNALLIYTIFERILRSSQSGQKQSVRNTVRVQSIRSMTDFISTCRYLKRTCTPPSYSYQVLPEDRVETLGLGCWFCIHRPDLLCSDDLYASALTLANASQRCSTKASAGTWYVTAGLKFPVGYALRLY